MQGGAVLNSGTYGCILKPAVPCKGETSRNPDSVSKLMTAKDAAQEYSEILAIKKKIKTIPDSNMYYIINDIKKCQIGPVTTSDLDDFDTKCSAMTRRSYTKEDVQNPRKNTNLRVLQLPDGGKDITSYFYNKPFSIDIFPKINRALIKLLKYGIVPLKEVGVIHQDIKGNNIVYSKDKDLARLIDWGLAEASAGGDVVPHSVKKWPLLFNQPFSNVVLHTTVQRVYKLMIEKNASLRSVIDGYRGRNLIQYLTPYVSKIIRKQIFRNDVTIEDIIGGMGHVSFIRSILRECMTTDWDLATANPGNSSFNTLANIISLHVSSALLHFSVKDNAIGEFDEKEYFNTVFKQNCDVFGLLSCYVDIFMNKHAPRSLRQMIYYHILKPFYLNEKYAYTPYDIDEISKACLALNNNYEKQEALVPSPAPALKRTVVDVVADTTHDKDKFVMALRKRCPNGTHRDKKTQKCLKKKVRVVKPPGSVGKRAPPATTTLKKAIPWPAGKRCPNGRRRHPKTKKCVRLSPQKKLAPKKEGRAPKKSERTQKKAISWPAGKRCPNGSYRDKKTKKCVKK